ASRTSRMPSWSVATTRRSAWSPTGRWPGSTGRAPSAPSTPSGSAGSGGRLRSCSCCTRSRGFPSNSAGRRLDEPRQPFGQEPVQGAVLLPRGQRVVELSDELGGIAPHGPGQLLLVHELPDP